MKKQVLLISLFVLCISYSLKSQPLIVDIDHPGAIIQPTMWGIFFEDINMAADGGLYAELIKNRSFEFADPRAGWRVKAKSKDSSAFIILNRMGTESNPHFARINVTGEMSSYCLSNAGFRGIGIKANSRYYFSLMGSVINNDRMRIRIELLDAKGKNIGDTSLTLIGKDWKTYNTEIIAKDTESHAIMNIWFENEGTVDLDLVSLFPEETWKNRRGGLRADMVQLLADLKPGFIRFPGGCIVEGRDLETRYEWKKTVGDVEDRQVLINRWNTEFKHRPTPDYFQSFGLGFFEYFLLAEDIGAEPLPILNCGMACQFNTAEVVPLDHLDPFIQDALDLIEFANGATDSKWGKIRTEMGHPQPFGMKMLGIGNEQWGPQYFERYKEFEKAIHQKYPDITLILSAGPSADGELFDFAWNELKNIAPQVVDEHYYKDPAWFLQNAGRYDGYDRKRHKIFAGEYAAQSVYTTSPDNQNNWQCALAEAAFMTGLERNADVVTMCSYAPLFAHTEGWQWKPDLIWFNNLNSFGTPNYYVQKLFSTNKGTHILSVLHENKPLTGQQGLYASAAMDKNANEVILKIVNVTGSAISQQIQLQTKKKLSTKGTLIQLQCNELDAINSFENLKVKPITTDYKIKGRELNFTCPPYSVNVIKLQQL